MKFNFFKTDYITCPQLKDAEERDFTVDFWYKFNQPSWKERIKTKIRKIFGFYRFPPIKLSELKKTLKLKDNIWYFLTITKSPKICKTYLHWSDEKYQYNSVYDSKGKLLEETKALLTNLKGYMIKKDPNLIPKGIYCHESGSLTKICPYWSIDNTKPEQANGYCAYLEKGDWDFNIEAEIVQIDPKTKEETIFSKKGEVPDMPWSLLWDQCKECGINEEDDD